MPVWTPVTPAWKLIFDDEFGDANLSKSRWGLNWLGAPGAVTKPVNGDEEAAYDPACVSFSGGLLKITPKTQSVTVNGVKYSYRSGLINTYDHFRFTRGYFEARLNCPGANGVINNWPAFWSNGETWPTDGEIDVFEGLEGKAAYHYHNEGIDDGEAVSGDFTGWHVYGAHWLDNEVRYYYDGREVGRCSRKIGAANQHYLIVNLGIGGWGGPKNLATGLQASYVHAYSDDPNARAVTPDAGYVGPGDDGQPAPPQTSESDTILQRATGRGLTEVVVVGENPDGSRYLDYTGRGGTSRETT